MTARRTSTSEISVPTYYVIPEKCPRLLQSYLKYPHHAEAGLFRSCYWLSQVDNATIAEVYNPNFSGIERYLDFDREDIVRSSKPDSQYLYRKGRYALVEPPLEATTLNQVTSSAAAWQVGASKGEDLEGTMWREYGTAWPDQQRIRGARRIPWTLAAAVKEDPKRVFKAWNGYHYWLLKGTNQVVPIGLTMEQREAAKPWSTLRPRKPLAKNSYRRRESDASESGSSSASKPSRWPASKWGLAGPERVPSRRVSIVS